MAVTQPDLFLPSDLDASQWEAIEPLVRQLLERPVQSREELERWILDRSEFDAAWNDARAQLYIRLSCDTENPEANSAYTRFVEDVLPRLKPKSFELDKRLVSLEQRFPLPAERYGVLLRAKRNDVGLFREENVPLQTAATRLVQEFDRIAGAQTVDFDGERTLPQMAKFLEVPDRDVRERAWRAINARRLQDREALNTIFDEMVSLRHRMARHVGLSNFVEYAFRERERFDYTPRECEMYWVAIERHVVPLARRLDEQRRRVMDVAELRPWDLAVDPRGRAALRPFEGGRELVRKARGVFHRLDPRLAAMFDELTSGEADFAAGGDDKGMRTSCLDLDSRRGKRPGGYQYMRDRLRKPFIFMNAAGLQRDVMTMLHEAGHAFHSQLCSGDPIVDYRHYPTEFAEVASMSMEHLTMPHWSGRNGSDGFYDNPEDLARARRTHLEDSITILAWIATIDSFQHWLYTHPDHTREERDDQWIELETRFGRAVSWEGLRDFQRNGWQRQSHLFSHPLYYIEYGIAQLGALQLWLKSRTEGERAAVDAYVRALRLGGSRPLPDLFAAAGLRFDFGSDTVARVVTAVEEELAKLPA